MEYITLRGKIFEVNYGTLDLRYMGIKDISEIKGNK